LKTLAFFLAFLACTSASAKCLLASQKAMTEAQLFFGRDIPGGGQVSDDDWSKFANDVVAADFPNGFTVTDADGAWRDAKTGGAVHERSKIVQIDGRATLDFARKVRHIAESYRARFHQDAVGIVTREVCAAF
jgi:hypothetical protein